MTQNVKTIFSGAMIIVTTLIAAPTLAASTALLGSFVGNVSLQLEDGSIKDIKPFTNLSGGESLVMGDDARIQLIYFSTAKEERWSGNSKLRIGDNASMALVGSPNQVKQLPTILVQQLKKLAAPRSNDTRVGMVRLRAISSARYNEVMGYYKELRQQLPADSALPEVFVVNTLKEEHDTKAMNIFMQEQLTQQPNNLALKQFAETFELPNNDKTP